MRAFAKPHGSDRKSASVFIWNVRLPHGDSTSRRAFTLVELLVVITIIGILVGLLMPAVQNARESGRQVTCKNNLRQIAVALSNYHTANEMLPAGANFPSGMGPTWAASILPHIEKKNVFERFDFSKHISHADNRVAVQAIIPTFICPSNCSGGEAALQGGRIQQGQCNPERSMGLWYPGSMGPTRDGTNPSVSCVFCPDGVGSYCCADTADYGCCGNNKKPGVGLFDRSIVAVRFSQVRDGLSNTIMVGETIPDHCTFNGAYNHNFPIAGTTIPINTMLQSDEGVNNLWYTACGFKSDHPGGALFAMADGSIHFFTELIDYQTYNELGSRDGKEAVRIPQ